MKFSPDKLIPLIMILALFFPVAVKAQGTFTEPVLLPGYAGDFLQPPAIGMANSGEAIIAYRRATDATVRGFYRSAYGAPFTAKILGQNASYPKVIANDAGDMVAAWIAFSGVTVSYKRRGTSTFVEKLLELGNVTGEIGLAMNSHGDIQLAWRAFMNNAPLGPRQEIHTFYKAGADPFPAGDNPYTVALSQNAGFPLVALDDSGNAAMYWIDKYASIVGADATDFKAVKQMLRPGANGAWGAPAFVSPTKGPPTFSCDSAVSGYPNAEVLKISSDPKTGLLGVAYHGSSNWRPHQGSHPEFGGRCVNISENYNYGIYTIFGTVLRGVSGTTELIQDKRLDRSDFAVSNASSAVALVTSAQTAVDTAPFIFKFGIGEPYPSLSKSVEAVRIVDVRVDMGADGTAIGTAYGSAGPAFEDGPEQAPVFAFVKRSGSPDIDHILMEEGALADVGINCRGDALFSVVTNKSSNPQDKNLYFVEYDSGNPTCIDGVVDPTPVPSPTPSPTPTPDPSVPTPLPTPEPTVDILAAAKRNSSRMHVALRNFYGAFTQMSHPAVTKKGGAQKLKNVKKTWKALQQEFPHSVVPELIYVPGKNAEQFRAYYLLLKKNYKKVMRYEGQPNFKDSKDKKKFREAKFVTDGTPDVMKNMLGFY